MIRFTPSSVNTIIQIDIGDMCHHIVITVNMMLLSERFPFFFFIIQMVVASVFFSSMTNFPVWYWAAYDRSEQLRAQRAFMRRSWVVLKCLRSRGYCTLCTKKVGSSIDSSSTLTLLFHKYTQLWSRHTLLVGQYQNSPKSVFFGRVRVFTARVLVLKVNYLTQKCWVSLKTCTFFH